VSDETTSDAVESASETEPTTGEDVETYKRRLRGKDQALTATQQERDKFRSEAERLAAKVREYEQANLTETERLQRERDEARAEAAAARAEAKKHALARKSPAYAEFLDSIADLDLTSEEAATAFEKFIAKREADEPEPEARIDPNNPRKTPPAKAVSRLTSDQLLEQIGNVDPSVLLGTR
jgi:hypothetical protein